MNLGLTHGWSTAAHSGQNHCVWAALTVVKSSAPTKRLLDRKSSTIGTCCELMRHRASIMDARPTMLLLPQAPPSCALDMVDAPDAAELVPLASGLLSFNACCAGARLAGINLAMVTAVAEHGAFAAPDTQKHATNAHPSAAKWQAEKSALFIKRIYEPGET